MTRWKPNLAPVNESSDKNKTEEARLVKIDKHVEPSLAWMPGTDASVIEESIHQERPSNAATQDHSQSPSKPSGQHNPLDEASIDDLGSFLELSSDEKTKEADASAKESQQSSLAVLNRIRPYLTYLIAGLVCMILAVATYAVYRIYFSQTQVSATVYILNNNLPVHDEALRITDPGYMTNFVQRFFVSMMLERNLSSNNETKFSSALSMLDWFRNNLKVEKDISDHAARISFNLTGSDPVLMSKLVDGYISSYIESKAAIDAQTPIVETSVSQGSSSVSNITKNVPAPSPELDAITNNLKVVDEKLRKLDEVDQEYVSALRLLSKDRLIGVTDSNIFRGFMSESELSSNSALAKLQNRVVELAVQKNALQVKFAPSSREIQSIEQEIRGIREAMRQYLNEQRQFVQARKGEFLTERAEVLRQKALTSMENEIAGTAAQVQQVNHPSTVNRRPVHGNLPSGRFWYVGQDGTTIISEPTTLVKTIAGAAVNARPNLYGNELSQQNMGYGPINQLNSNVQMNQLGSNGHMNQLSNSYAAAPINGAPGYLGPMNQFNQIQPAPQYNAPQQQPSANQGHGASLQKTAEYDQRFPYGAGYAPAQSQSALQSQTQAPQTQYQTGTHFANPLHTGVGQSPLMSNGLGSKFHQPNAAINRSQTQTFRGSY